MRTLPLLLLLTGCGVATLDFHGESGRQATDAELQAARCAPYPWTVNVGPPAESAARAELAALAPSATMTWSAVRNTPSGLFAADFLLDCPEGKDVFEVVFAFAAAHPALFQVDPTEWALPRVPCEALPETANWLSTSRLTYAGQPARSDTFAFRARRQKERVVVEAVAGSWIPPASYVDRLALRRCASLEPKRADETARRAPLGYTVFDWCAPQKSYDYLAQPADTLELDAAAAFEWSDQSGKVELRKVHRGRLVLAPSSYTPELLSSDANCPRPGGAPYVGFELDFDAVTGELLRQKPGVGCIVCLGP